MGRRMTNEQLKGMHEAIHADAERKVRAGLLMSAIARKHEIKVSDDDVEQAFVELAAQSGKNVAKMRAEYREQGRREVLLSMILEDKVLDLIESRATVKDGPVGEASAAAGEVEALPEANVPAPSSAASEASAKKSRKKGEEG
jgi:trigger factor